MRLVRSPQLVTGPVPIRMRLPLAPAGSLAGGSISAGMISTVQTPFPILAQTIPKICPHFWAPSPESDTTSTVCWPVRWIFGEAFDGSTGGCFVRGGDSVTMASSPRRPRDIYRIDNPRPRSPLAPSSVPAVVSPAHLVGGSPETRAIPVATACADRSPNQVSGAGEFRLSGEHLTPCKGNRKAMSGSAPPAGTRSRHASPAGHRRASPSATPRGLQPLAVMSLTRPHSAGAQGGSSIRRRPGRRRWEAPVPVPVSSPPATPTSHEGRVAGTGS